MLQWIIGASAKFRLIVIAVAVSLLGVGFSRMSETAVEALPDFGPVRVEVKPRRLDFRPKKPRT